MSAHHVSTAGDREEWLGTLYLWEPYAQWLRVSFTAKQRARRIFLLEKEKEKHRGLNWDPVQSRDLNCGRGINVTLLYKRCSPQSKGIRRVIWCSWLTPSSLTRSLSTCHLQAELFVFICALLQDNQLSWKKKSALYNILAYFQEGHSNPKTHSHTWNGDCNNQIRKLTMIDILITLLEEVTPC